MTWPWAIAVGGLALLLVAGCGRSARHGQTLNYELSLDVAQAGARKAYAQVISVTPSQSYNYGAGWQGWGGLGCRVTGSAIPIDVEGGTLFATLKRSARTEPDADQCRFLREYLGIPNGDKNGAWVKDWNTIAASDRRFPLPLANLPQFLFIPDEGGWLGARAIKPDELSSLGVTIEKASMTITRSPAVINPRAKEANAAFGRLDRNQKRTMERDVIDCLSGLVAEARA